MKRAILLLLTALMSLIIVNTSKAWFIGPIPHSELATYLDWHVYYILGKPSYRARYVMCPIPSEKGYAYYGIEFQAIEGGIGVAIENVTLMGERQGDPDGTGWLSWNTSTTLAKPVYWKDLQRYNNARGGIAWRVKLAAH